MAKRTRRERRKQPAPGTQARRDDARAAFTPDASGPPIDRDDLEAALASPPTAAARPAPASSTARGRFWLDFEIPWAKWVAFRFVFFALHAVDAFLQLSHAPRYGAGGFNVQQLPGAPLPEPSRLALTFVYGALCVLFALIAQGCAVRWLLPIATVLYGYAYFVSQLDSYQHHYLLWLVLVLLCFVPARPAPAPAGARVAWQRSWALRLVLVQLAVVYLWAAIAKLDPVWLDGTALTRQISTGWMKSLAASLGHKYVAVAIVCVELALAVTIWNRVLWPLALALGVGLHVGIELIGLDIGLFSYFMLALYLLLVPDVVFLRAAPLAARAGRAFARVPLPARAALAVAAIVFAAAVVLRHPLPLGRVIALLVLLAPFLLVPAWVGGTAALARRLRQLAVALGTLALLLLVTEVANDHYRMWGGASRRMGIAADERAAYTGLLAVDPTSEYAHYYLGQAERLAGRDEAALAHFRAAQRSEPARDRAYLAEAAVHLAADRRDEAIAVLERGVVRAPDSAPLRTRLGELGVNVPLEDGHEP